MAKRGRKSKYEEYNIEDRLPEIEQMARDGYRDEDIWTTLGIGRGTFYNWREKYPEFADAIRKGKQVVDAEIENSLINNAKGHVFWEETQQLVTERDEETGFMVERMKTVERKLKYIKPDTTAQIFWLKNRQPHKWRDKQHLEHSGGVGIGDLEYMDDDELDKALKEFEGND